MAAARPGADGEGGRELKDMKEDVECERFREVLPDWQDFSSTIIGNVGEFIPYIRFCGDSSGNSIHSG